MVGGQGHVGLPAVRAAGPWPAAGEISRCRAAASAARRFPEWALSEKNESRTTSDCSGGNTVSAVADASLGLGRGERLRRAWARSVRRVSEGSSTGSPRRSRRAASMRRLRAMVKIQVEGAALARSNAAALRHTVSSVSWANSSASAGLGAEAQHVALHPRRRSGSNSAGERGAVGAGRRSRRRHVGEALGGGRSGFGHAAATGQRPGGPASLVIAGLIESDRMHLPPLRRRATLDWITGDAGGPGPIRA